MSASPDTLIVAPYVGEFGWELMNWQGRVRRVIAEGRHERVIVCAEPDRRAIYAQPSSGGRVIFYAAAPLTAPGHRNEDHRVDEQGRPIAAAELRSLVEKQVLGWCEDLGVRPDEASMLMPGFNGEIWPTSAPHQTFASLRVCQATTTDVVIVPRVRHSAPERNRPMAWWEELAELLGRRGLAVEMYEPRADRAIRQFSRARLAIGASTGGLHLASLCRCPHYVWGSGPEARWTRLGITNRQRYETVWNPLGTPCRYDECGWQPSMERVIGGTLAALDEIGLRQGGAAPRWSLKPKWRLKRRLAGVFETSGAACVWPWRLRRAVREYVV